MNPQRATVAPLHREASSRLLAGALNCGDLDAAAACFARDACLITPDATAVETRERIRPVLAQMIARRTEIVVELSSAIAAGDVVLLRERWRVRAGEPGGRVEETLDPTLVLRQIEGDWKVSIAAPWSSIHA
jgi:ketosteroid isomerase-like protein